MKNDSEERDDSITAEENMAETVKKLRVKLKEAEKKSAEYLIGWQRAKADLVNARKQDEKDKQDFIKFANEKLVKEILSVVTSFEMAMANKIAWESVDKNWRIGVEHIYTQLKKVLADHGVIELDPVGKKYDPARDEAAEHEPVDEKAKEGIITAVIQKGYSINGKVLKAPKVKVGEHKSSQTAK